MNIFVYSDESGVFDYIHNDYFVFAGLIFLSKNEKDIETRKYSNVEKTIRKNNKYGCCELKATLLKPNEKRSIFRSLNNSVKFSAVINQKQIKKEIFSDKKTKQRYLDYAYKIAVKQALKNLIDKGVINPRDVDKIFFYVDEHTTATNGMYELKEGLESELKKGTFNYNYNIFYKPLFPTMNSVELKYCNSEKVTMIRAADIIANNIYHIVINNNGKINKDIKNMHICYLP